ncbi:MAG: hypothetical protein ACREPM_13365 [Gemmatimonadaceae bacterium]
MSDNAKKPEQTKNAQPSEQVTDLPERSVSESDAHAVKAGARPLDPKK